MVYLYKKIIHGKPYYYLRMSKKVKNKTIVKDIAYLGTNISKIQLKLSKLPAVYKKDIKKAYYNIKKFIESEYYLNKAKKLKLKSSPYLDKNSLQEIEAIKLHFNEKFLKLDKTTINETYKNFLIDFAFNTTSIEGNTITLEEANKLLKENLTPKNRTLKEIYDLQNTEKVFFDILDSKEEIDNDFIIKIHDNLLENIDLRKGYRNRDIRVFRANFKATPFVYIKTDMNLLLKWLKKNKKKFHPLFLFGIFHQKFEKIHPFFDGNGRTGRMLLNYMLLKHNYPPLIVRLSRRSDYLNFMGQANNLGITEVDSKYFKKLINYLAEEMIWSYWNNFLV